MNIFIILLIISIIVLCFFYFINYNNKKEYFVCNSDNLHIESLFKPYNFSFRGLKSINDSIFEHNNFVNKSHIETLISYIPISKNTKNFVEIKGVNYDYHKGLIGYKYSKSEINLIFSNVFKTIKKSFLIANKLYPKYCNDVTNCELLLIDKKIISKKKYNNEIAINGQLLLKFNISDYLFLIEFLASYTNKINIYEIKLTGINLENEIFNDKTPNISFVNIFSKPEYNLYDAKSKYLYSDNENINIKKYKNNIKKSKEKLIFNNEYSCFGKNEIDKYNCESKYDRNGDLENKQGTWDKYCSSDSECPFYKKNKNYKNTFGKCVDGWCEFPLGLKRLSPRKYTGTPICYNCNEFNCCEKQKERKLYPKLNSPDYVFNNDRDIRSKMNYE